MTMEFLQLACTAHHYVAPGGCPNCAQVRQERLLGAAREVIGAVDLARERDQVITPTRVRLAIDLLRVEVARFEPDSGRDAS